jgi:hypothetical protein
MLVLKNHPDVALVLRQEHDATQGRHGYMTGIGPVKDAAIVRQGGEKNPKEIILVSCPAGARKEQYALDNWCCECKAGNRGSFTTWGGQGWEILPDGTIAYERAPGFILGQAAGIMQLVCRGDIGSEPFIAKRAGSFAPRFASASGLPNVALVSPGRRLILVMKRCQSLAVQLGDEHDATQGRHGFLIQVGLSSEPSAAVVEFGGSGKRELVLISKPKGARKEMYSLDNWHGKAELHNQQSFTTWNDHQWTLNDDMTIGYRDSGFVLGAMEGCIQLVERESTEVLIARHAD